MNLCPYCDQEKNGMFCYCDEIIKWVHEKDEHEDYIIFNDDVEPTNIRLYKRIHKNSSNEEIRYYEDNGAIFRYSFCFINTIYPLKLDLIQYLLKTYKVNIYRQLSDEESKQYHGKRIPNL